MPLSNPIEVDVIRDLALRARSDEPPPGPETAFPDPKPEPRAPTPGREERDVDDLMDLLHCGKRRGVLCILACAAAAAGRDQKSEVRDQQSEAGGDSPDLTSDLRPLTSAPSGSVCVGEIARRLGLSQKNLSQHLLLLKTAGLIFVTPRGQRREYEITPGRVVYQRDPTTGRVQLQVFAAGGSGVSVTITVPGAAARPAVGRSPASCPDAPQDIGSH